MENHSLTSNIYFLARKKTEFLTVDVQGETHLLFAENKRDMAAFLKRRKMKEYEVYELHKAVLIDIVMRNKLSAASMLKGKSNDDVTIYPRDALSRQKIDFLDYALRKNKALYTIERVNENDKRFYITSSRKDLILFLSLRDVKQFAKTMDKKCKIAALNAAAIESTMKNVSGLWIMDKNDIILYQSINWQAEAITRKIAKEMQNGKNRKH